MFHHHMKIYIIIHVMDFMYFLFFLFLHLLLTNRINQLMRYCNEANRQNYAMCIFVLRAKWLHSGNSTIRKKTMY